MAACAWCRQEMTTARSCTVDAMHVDGRRVAMIRYRAGGRAQKRVPRCGDCGVEPGGWHHLGCDQQRCPLCRRQMFSCGCRFDEDPVEDDWDDEDDWVAEPHGVDSNGMPTEVRRVGEDDVIIHYADIPESDITVHKGIRVTTPLRTVIDLASDLEPAKLDDVVSDCLERGLFTLEQAWERLAQPDMADYPGAVVLRRHLGAES